MNGDCGPIRDEDLPDDLRRRLLRSLVETDDALDDSMSLHEACEIINQKLMAALDPNGDAEVPHHLWELKYLERVLLHVVDRAGLPGRCQYPTYTTGKIQAF